MAEIDKQEKITVTTAEAASVLGLCRVTITHMIKDGRLPAINVGGGKFLILKDELDKLINSGRSQK